jgi:hypothetical protein
MAMVARPEVLPMSGDGKAETALPSRLGFR